MVSASSASRAKSLFRFVRRAYSSTAAENVVKAREMAGNKVECGLGKDVFWMKDPKTGNWMPETHFDQVNAAELRAKLWSKKAAASS